MAASRIDSVPSMLMKRGRRPDDRPEPAGERLSDPAGDWDEPQLTTERPLIGRRLGDLVIRALLGRGAYGRVYLADQAALGREVAVKVLHSRHTANSQVVQRFHREARAASQLNHPNVVSIYDYGRTDDGLLYIAMEYLRGTNLRTHLNNAIRLSAYRAVEVMMSVLHGLEEAHAAGVIHADLKADNVFLHGLRHGGELVKLIDFGIARILHESQPVAPRPGGTIKLTGTPEYMAPEVIRGGALAASADIYAAGVLLYELLTGTLPFTGGDAIEVLTRQCGEIPTAPSARCSAGAIPPELERIVLRALAKDPAQRFADAASFRHALAALCLHPQAQPCSGCGAVPDHRDRFCAACGAALTAPAPRSPSRSDIDRHKAQAVRAFECGEHDAAIDILRRAAGQAIRLGRVRPVLDVYTTLAAMLERTGAIADAVDELTEGLGLVTGGDPGNPEASEPLSAMLWQPLLHLAALHRRLGHHDRARTVSALALSHARRGAPDGVQAQVAAAHVKDLPLP
ncbi:serine/threonine-protein kinase [Haliangium sp.]|uniref:serine/threonine-protein kinase n=1 Tax=Haliangium sp. TaxID=2663208 RepID=UPI003D0FC3AC